MKPQGNHEGTMMNMTILGGTSCNKLTEKEMVVRPPVFSSSVSRTENGQEIERMNKKTI